MAGILWSNRDFDWSIVGEILVSISSYLRPTFYTKLKFYLSVILYHLKNHTELSWEIWHFVPSPSS